jgi:hypothetical protein
MTLPVTRKNPAILSAAATSQASPPAKQHGWDPFEVWRTRILLPRLADTGKPDTPNAPIQLVRR